MGGTPEARDLGRQTNSWELSALLQRQCRQEAPCDCRCGAPEASQRYQAALGRVLCVSQHSQVPAANLP